MHHNQKKHPSKMGEKRCFRPNTITKKVFQEEKKMISEGNMELKGNSKHEKG